MNVEELLFQAMGAIRAPAATASVVPLPGLEGVPPLLIKHGAPA